MRLVNDIELLLPWSLLFLFNIYGRKRETIFVLVSFCGNLSWSWFSCWEYDKFGAKSLSVHPSLSLTRKRTHSCSLSLTNALTNARSLSLTHTHALFLFLPLSADSNYHYLNNENVILYALPFTHSLPFLIIGGLFYQFPLEAAIPRFVSRY